MVDHASHCRASQNVVGGGRKVDDPSAPYPYRVGGPGDDQDDEGGTYQMGGVIVWGGDDLQGEGGGERGHVEGGTQDENLYLIYQVVAVSHVQRHVSDRYALICLSQRR